MHNRDEGGFSHFALIFIDQAGNLRHEASPSISGSRERILSPSVTNEFLQAVARSEDNRAKIQCWCHLFVRSILWSNPKTLT
jgi:hypothetical protein